MILPTPKSQNCAALLKGPYRLHIKLPGLPRTTNGSHGHWRTRSNHVKIWKAKVFTACWSKAPPEPLKQARIKFTRASSSRPDYDNLVISFKSCMDGLRQARIITDDRHQNVGIPEYTWVQAPIRKGYVEIEIEEVNETNKQGDE
jgi:Holliday junction resolvase RusA-like endonuclease